MNTLKNLRFSLLSGFVRFSGLALVGLALFFGASSAFAQSTSRPLGLGLILFGPTGFSTNYYLTRNTSFDTAWSWSMNDDDQNLYVHGTYLFHRPDMLQIDRVALDVHFGGGLRIISWDDRPGRHRKHDDDTYIGVRGAAGTSYVFNPAIQVFGELSLTMDLIPETDADLDLALGARFYF